MRKRNKKFICVQTRVGACTFFAENQGRASAPFSNIQLVELVWELVNRPVVHPDGTKVYGKKARLILARALVSYLKNPPVMSDTKRTAVDLRVLLRRLIAEVLNEVTSTTYGYLMDAPPLNNWEVRLQDSPDIWIRALTDFKDLVPKQKDFANVYEFFYDMWKWDRIEPEPKKEDMEALLLVLIRAKAIAIKMRM